MTVGADERFVVISADCHAGGSMDTYGEYLDDQYQDQFAVWRAAYRNPFRDLQSKGRERNWDSDQRIAELEADGQVAEVIFPNTVPPFFPTGALVARPPTADDLELRWAGLRAHNRWLADWCRDESYRRAGIAQVFLNDVDAAVEEARWIAQSGLKGGVLIPAVPDDCDIEPLYSEAYDPLWAVCEEHGLVVNSHSGSGHPDYGDHPASTLVWAIETPWMAHRPLWHMILGGVFERFPNLKFTITEAGCAWIPEFLTGLDNLMAGIRSNKVGEMRIGGELVPPKSATEYFQQNCYVGISQPRPLDIAAGLGDQVGIDRVMWGSDYPHDEGTFPYTTEHFRQVFSGLAPEQVQQILAGNAAELYGFDLAALKPLADQFGPTVGEVQQPLTELPADANQALVNSAKQLAAAS
jgi:predicted TIM-barrel fold metal-dependent hydrolase